MSSVGFRIRWNVLRSALHEAWPAWLLITGFISTWFLAYFLANLIRPDLSTQVRYAGAMLEVLGLLLVAHGIRQLRQVFGRPSIIAKIAQWFKQIANAFGKPKSHTLSVSVGAHAMVGGNVGLIITAAKGATMERRVEVLEQNLGILRSEVREKTDHLETKVTEVSKTIHKERNQRVTAIENATRTIEEVAIGGLKLEIVGLAWLTAGALGTSIPDEISKIVSAIP